MKEKGIKILVSIFLFASVLMPFSVYADTTIPVTYNSQSVQSQWQSHLTVTNYCESPLQGSTPCKLTFTLDDNYFGMISFDGYAGNSLALSYVTVFVAGGVGEYNYRTFSNANPMYINYVNIMGVGLHLPDSNIDLTDIINLLTAIESDTTAIDSTTDTILIQLQSLVNQAIISNGYLEILTKMRQWNFPIESFSFVSSLMYYYSNKIVDYYVVNNKFTFPIFSLNQDDILYYTPSSTDEFKMVVFIADNMAWSLNQIKNNLINFGSLDVDNFNYWGNTRFWFNDQTGYFCSFNIHTTAEQAFRIKLKKDLYIIPIYCNSIYKNYVSTEFALQFGLSNSFLDNIEIIANGTIESNSAASDLDSNTNQMQSDFNSYYSIENTANSDFNSALNGINFNDQIAGNQSFLDSASFVKTVFSSMMQIPILSTFVIILCIILMARIFL